uniref:BURP domain-containing protein 3-like n=1 Tax=Erigeron canadensis TaxID=72917 RepID=UPI001CB8D9F3|nr:BURP domain-containing protein 3-like [Erigeron canadensis]
MTFLHILPFLYLAMVVSHAAVAPETYWKSVLPNTPMPKAVTDLLHADKSTDINIGVGKGGVSVHAPGTNIGVGGGGGVSVHAPGTNVGVGKGGGVSVNTPGTSVGVGKGGVSVHAPGTNVGVGKGGASVHAPGTNVGVGKGGASIHAPGTNVGVGKPGTSLGVSKDGVSVNAPGTHVSVGGKGGDVTVHAPKPKGDCEKITIGDGSVIIRCHHEKGHTHVHVDPFSYNYAATDDQLKDDPNVALFFLENDMHHGNAMSLHFTRTNTPSVTFLPRKVADKIPFSSKDLPELYTRFSIKPDTIESESMKKTINECEDKGLEGEKKYCATSLEAMVDFSTSELGKKVKVVSTEVRARKPTPMQKYTIEGAKKLAADRAVVCHKQKYPYAVFYCHKTTTTKAYTVSLVGEDGTRAKAVGVCHTDTAKWNPKHLAFRVLKVKPGTSPVCHFLPEDHLVWVPY